MTNASHDPRREFEHVLCVAAACGSSDDAQARTPAGNKAASACFSNVSATERQYTAWYTANTTDVQQYKLNTVQAHQPNAMPHLTQCAMTYAHKIERVAKIAAASMQIYMWCHVS